MQRLDALMLLRGVREVASHADPENPIQVSQRRFDDARQISRTFAHLPRAKRIAERLRMPWRDVLLLAHAPASTHAHRLGRIQTEPKQDWLSEHFIAFALRLVARRLDVASVSPIQYRTEREKLMREDRAAFLHGRQLRLPSEDQIRIAVGGDWSRALALAGLTARSPHAGQADSTVELLERCYAAHGTEPSALELRRFARANHIPWTPDRQRTWLESVATWKLDRRARGLHVPDGPPLRHLRPDYAVDVGAARPDEHRRRDWSDIEDCLPHVIAYLEQLPSGAHATKRGYQAWARDQADAPAYSAFDQHAGWERLRSLALAEMAARHRSHTA